MVATCSHLFWAAAPSPPPPPPADDDDDAETAPPPAPDAPAGRRDAKRVLECLKRSCKIADACMTSHTSTINLFVEILDHYVVHFERDVPGITAKHVSTLVALINEHLESMEDNDARAAVERHYQNTLARVRAKQIADV